MVKDALAQKKEVKETVGKCMQYICQSMISSLCETTSVMRLSQMEQINWFGKSREVLSRASNQKQNKKQTQHRKHQYVLFNESTT